MPHLEPVTSETVKKLEKPMVVTTTSNNKNKLD